VPDREEPYIFLVCGLEGGGPDWRRDNEQRGHARKAWQWIAHHDEADLTGPSVSEEQKSFHEEVERLRLEIEHLLDQQKAFSEAKWLKGLEDENQKAVERTCFYKSALFGS
jgi:hypothetical protein